MKAGFRTRPGAGEDVASLNEVLASRLARVIGPWAGSFDESSAHFEAEQPDGGAADFTSCLPEKYWVAASYCPRQYIDGDLSRFDDVLSVHFETPPADYGAFATRIFEQLVLITSAYRAQVVADEDQDLVDFEKICHLSSTLGGDIDGRDGVYRIGPLNYFDDQLCRRAFDLAPGEVIRRLEGKVETAKLVCGGVLLLVSSDLQDTDELRSIDGRLREYLHT